MEIFCTKMQIMLVCCWLLETRNKSSCFIWGMGRISNYLKGQVLKKMPSRYIAVMDNFEVF